MSRRSRAFTLVELLVVVAIIALLVSILMPTLGRARDLARRQVCAATLHGHGKVLAMYVNTTGTYPQYAPWPWGQPNPLFWADGSGFSHEHDGWPKFYTILKESRIKGTRRTTWNVDWYGGVAAKIPAQNCFCPGMDYVKILRNAEKSLAAYGFDDGTSGNNVGWVNYHQWAAGYQWNPYLRAAYPNTDCASGGAGPQQRYPKRVKLDAQWYDFWQWIGTSVGLADGRSGQTQAISPNEIAQPSRVAEAWDTWDMESTPAINWKSKMFSTGALTPGWHGGVVTRGGRAIFNGFRHKGAPSMLYADGHIASGVDMRPVNPAADGWTEPKYEGMQAYTWGEWDSVFGNLSHLLPNAELE